MRFLRHTLINNFVYVISRKKNDEYVYKRLMEQRRTTLAAGNKRKKRITMAFTTAGVTEVMPMFKQNLG